MSAWAEREGRIAGVAGDLAGVRSGLFGLAELLHSSEAEIQSFQLAELIQAMGERMDAPLKVLAEDET